MLVVLAAGLPGTVGASSWTRDELVHPIDPTQLTQLPFGRRSFWMQPWRSSLTTWPAVQLEQALGLNANVPPAQMAGLARLMRLSGMRRARLEIGWNAMSFADPSQPADPASLTPSLRALRANGIRPLILLNADQQQPVPTQTVTLHLLARAPAGTTTLLLQTGDAHLVAPGRTGFDTPGLAAGVLITSVSPLGIATLSRPLPFALAAGAHAATTLRFAPFAPPYLVDGRTPNPAFQATLAGWNAYVTGICRFVRGVLGSDRFDVEVWNELSFGSDFLSQSAYYAIPPDPTATGQVTTALLSDTVHVLHAPGSGLGDVEIGDGFSDQTPFAAGGTVPAGVAALDKHPYANPLSFPSAPESPTIIPLDALEEPFTPAFTPHYRVFMPEYFLTGLQTESLMRDLSPITTSIYGVAHGARTHPPGAPAPVMWITEANMAHGPSTTGSMPARDWGEFQAKVALRYDIAYAGEGARAIDLFAAAGGGGLQIVPQAYLVTAAAHHGRAPLGLGGPTMTAVRRMVSTLAGARPIAHPHQLSLDAIASDSDTDVQFTGNGTAQAPSLFNRDVLAFFPFQVRAHRFVCGVYVMTSDLSRRYTSHPAHGATPYDLPPESFRLTIGGLDARRARVSLYDPLRGTRQPARIVARDGSRIVVQLQATDAPRMLTIAD